jgi:transaldolase
VNLGKAISAIVKGYVSTEVDPRLSFDMEESLSRARRIIAMYEEEGVPRSIPMLYIHQSRTSL